MSQVNWGARPSKKTGSAPAVLDDFVSGGSKAKSIKRLNLNIPSDLHARIKAQCALEGRDMTETLIQLLESRFPVQ